MKKKVTELCDRPVANIARLQSRHIYKGNSHQEDIRYGAWGEFLDTYHGNGNTEEYTNAGVLFGYNGKAYDSFSKLYNYGFRDLSVTRRQWQTQDPIRDGLNWQTYLGGVADPVNMIDLWGLKIFAYTITYSYVTSGTTVYYGEDAQAVYNSRSEKIKKYYYETNEEGKKVWKRKSGTDGENVAGLKGSNVVWNFVKTILGVEEKVKISAIKEYEAPLDVKGNSYKEVNYEK